MMDYSKMSDEELLSLVNLGDKAATDVFYKRFGPLVTGIARKFYLYGADIADLTQEGMIGIFKAVKSYDASKGKLKNYLAACIKNQILDAVRSANAKGNSPLNSALSLSVWVDGEDIGDNIESDELTPLDTLIENEGRHDFLTMLHSKLNDTETEILKGFLGGDSYKIIASNCGVSEKKVDNTISKIKKLAKKVNA